MSFLPTHSRVGHLSTSAIETVYQVLGPFPEGSWVRRLYVHFDLVSGATVDWAASLGGVPEASGVALDAGMPFVQATGSFIGETPAIRVVPGAMHWNAFVLPVGLRVARGAGWLVWAVANAGETVTLVTMGVEVVRRVKLKELEGRE